MSYTRVTVDNTQVYQCPSLQLYTSVLCRFFITVLVCEWSCYLYKSFSSTTRNI